MPDNADEKSPYCAGYNKAINDAIDLFGEWMCDLLDEYPDLEQDMQEHDRERIEEWQEELDTIEAETEDEEMLQQVRELRAEIEEISRQLKILEKFNSNSGKGSSGE